MNMNNIIITTRKEAAVTDEQLYALFNSAYDQWRDNSLDYPFLHKSFEEFQKSIDPVLVTIAIDTATGEPVGMRGVACYRKKRYAFDFCLSVAPEYKRKGIATRLMEFEKEILRQHGYRYLTCNTSADAPWSVSWHRKMGYLITGYHLSPNTSGPKYSYRMQLLCDPLRHPTDLLWTRPLAPVTARCSLALSYAITWLTKDAQGRDNLLGRLARKIIHKGH
jgi:ribosomal protein S18 acetylase RimI-like enzyme